MRCITLDNPVRLLLPTYSMVCVLVGRLKRTGRWDEAEHQLFLRGVELYGKKWGDVCTFVGTRTAIQTRTHAQKYFAKLARHEAKRVQQPSPVEAAAAMALLKAFWRSSLAGGTARRRTARPAVRDDQPGPALATAAGSAEETSRK